MAKRDPIFAVIIPVYNGQEYIADCLDSLINQDYLYWISICVNDGSTDNTEKILRKYASQDSRIHLISKDNGGVSNARNTALDYLQNLEYDWISFLDADDMLKTDNLSNLKEIICKNPEIDYIRTHCKSYQNRKDMYLDVATIHPNTSVKILKPNQYFNNGDVGGLTHSCHISRTLFEKNAFKFPIDMKILEDQVFSIKYALRSRQVAITQSLDYLYFTPPSSNQGDAQANNKYPDEVSDIVRCINYISEFLHQNDDIPKYFDSTYFPIKVELLLKRLAKGSTLQKIELIPSFTTWNYCKSFKTKILYLFVKIRHIKI